MCERGQKQEGRNCQNEKQNLQNTTFYLMRRGA